MTVMCGGRDLREEWVKLIDCSHLTTDEREGAGTLEQ